ncbi:hypothetical protein BSN82_17640, partial [Acinetobacter baylyi]
TSVTVFPKGKYEEGAERCTGRIERAVGFMSENGAKQERRHWQVQRDGCKTSVTSSLSEPWRPGC